MPVVDARSPLVAINYAEGSDAAQFMHRVVGLLSAQGVACAGFLQRDVVRPGRSRCDMVLHEIASGRELQISEDRGSGARGCRLDEAELVRATALAIDGLTSRPQVLLLNKFGKSEAEGRGFRPLIAAAVESGITVITPVPWRNAESWKQFAGELASACTLDALLGLPDADVLRALGLTLTGPSERSACATT